jgi:hypothetical protein
MAGTSCPVLKPQCPALLIFRCQTDLATVGSGGTLPTVAATIAQTIQAQSGPVYIENEIGGQGRPWNVWSTCGCADGQDPPVGIPTKRWYRKGALHRVTAVCYLRGIVVLPVAWASAPVPSSQRAVVAQI